MLSPEVIVKVDGGVSSQMLFYKIGEWLREHRGYVMLPDTKESRVWQRRIHGSVEF